MESGRKNKLVRLEGRARKACFERLRKGLQKKASQIASLCAVRIALVIKDIDDAPDMPTWPPNLDEVRCTVGSYQQRAFDVKAGNTTGKKRKRVDDAANFASVGSKMTKSNQQGLGERGCRCGWHQEDVDLKLESINHRIGVITMAVPTADSVPVPNVPSCSSLTPIDLSGEEAAWCDITEPEDSYALPYSVVSELGDSHTDFGPAACCPTGIGSYNAAWDDVLLPDDLYADMDATLLINPSEEAAAFSHPFSPSCAAGSNFMELGPNEDFYPGHLSDITEMEGVDFFNGLDPLVLLEADDFGSYDPLTLQPSSPSSYCNPSPLFHSYCGAVTDQFY